MARPLFRCGSRVRLPRRCSMRQKSLTKQTKSLQCRERVNVCQDRPALLGLSQGPSPSTPHTAPSAALPRAPTLEPVSCFLIAEGARIVAEGTPACCPPLLLCHVGCRVPVRNAPGIICVIVSSSRCQRHRRIVLRVGAPLIPLLSRLQHHVRLRGHLSECRSTHQSKRTEQHRQIFRVSHIRADPLSRFGHQLGWRFTNTHPRLCRKSAGGNP